MPRPLSRRMRATAGWFIAAFFALLLSSLTVPFFGNAQTRAPNAPLPPGTVEMMVPLHGGVSHLAVRAWAVTLTHGMWLCAILFLIAAIILIPLAGAQENRESGITPSPR